MKYIKGNQTWKIEDAPNVKLRLTDGQGFNETPWGVSSPDNMEYAMVNNALAFMPYPSWGAIFTKTNFNFIPILDKQELVLHPDAFEFYLSEGAIDEEGNYKDEYTEKFLNPSNE